MKKLALLMLMAVLALPMMAQGKFGEGADAVRRVTHVAPGPAFKSFKVTKVTKSREDVPSDKALVKIVVVDNPNHGEGSGVWGDGSGYQMLLDADANTYGTIIPEIGVLGSLTSSGDVPDETYAEFEYKIPENADGALTTSNVIVSGTGSVMIPAGIYDWCITNPTPGDRVWIASSDLFPGRYDNYEFRGGATYTFTISFAIEHDQTELVIDDPSVPTAPVDITADPAATTASIAWVAGENNSTWNLRYRPYVDPPQDRFWDFPLHGYQEQAAEFISFDADGDGYSWELTYTDGYNNDICYRSKSYDYGLALSPDNWLFTPPVVMGGKLRFKTWNGLSAWPDKIMVYVCTNLECDDLDEFTPVSGFIQPGGSPEEVEIDLGDFSGTGYIAFRHYDCSNEYYISIDDIEVTDPNHVVVPEWIEIDDVSSPYTIEGLTPETEYEAQIQGVASDGRLSNWNESTIFTTLAGSGEEPADVCATPDVDHVISGYEEATVIITNNEPGAEVYYEVSNYGVLIDAGSFTGDNYSFTISGVGDYVVTAVAKLNGMADSSLGYDLFTISEGQTPDTPEPDDMTIVLVIIDQYGYEHMFDLAKGDNGDYTTTVSLDYVPYGQFAWNPELSPAENNANRPNVPYYFLIDGVRYGASAELVATVLGTALDNELVEGEGFYTLPVGYNYNLGVAISSDGSQFYVYAAQAGFTNVNELNAGKIVAAVRYFNVMGQEMAWPQGVTIVVTTYTDGDTSVVKVMK